MKLETERLVLFPLHADQLELWVTNLTVLEEQLKAVYRADALDGFFGDIVKGQIEITRRDAVQYYFHTFWLLIEKQMHVIIGSADFKNVPDASGTVEIGYGMGADFQGRGYMTEAASTMCRWALNRKDVHRVVAETEKWNIASMRVLQKCGMHRLKETKDSYWWEIS